MCDWTQAQGHQRQLSDSLLNDETPPGLWIKKNLDVIECFTHLKLQALQMLGMAENCLTNAILEHNATLKPLIPQHKLILQVVDPH